MPPPSEVVVLDGPTTVLVSSPEQSLSTTSATTTNTDYSVASSLENADSFSSEEFQIDDSFWTETLAMTPAEDSSDSGMETGDDFGAQHAASAAPATSSDDMDFWLRLFMQAGGMQNLAEM
ncbi:hypothetical protein EJB05_20733, partial [Eragrostis curvula]